MAGKMQKYKKLPALPLILEIILILITSLCYLNSYDGDFVFDDSPAIVNNKDVSTTPLNEIFVNDFWGSKLKNKQSHRSYRPLTILTFRFHYWLRGYLEKTDFHFFNQALHSIVCLLTFVVYRKLFMKKYKQLAFYGAILFAVHPVHCEAVSGIVGRADVLSAMFVWLSMLSYDKCIYSKLLYKMFLYLLLTVILITAAMLCKETGITAIGLCAAYELFKLHETNPNIIYELKKEFLNIQEKKSLIVDNYKFIIRLLMLIITGIGLMAIRFSLMGFSTPTFQAVDNPASFINNLLLRNVNYHYIYSLNLWLLICPDWLSFDWSMGSVPLIKNWDMRICAILGLWSFFGVFLWIIVKKPQQECSRLISMSLCLLVIPFLPASNLFFNVGFVLAERTLYLPSSGYCLLLTILLHKLTKLLTNRTLPLLLFTTLTVLWLSKSWLRSDEWRRETTLFRSALRICPLNAKVHYNVAKSAADMGNTALAEAEYRVALQLHPDYAQAMNNLGNLLKDQGRHDDAEKLLRRALEIQPDFPAAWMNLGIVLSALKKFNDSEEAYKTSLYYRSNCPDCYYNLGILYMELKQYNMALDAWQRALELRHKHRRAWTNTIRLLDDLDRSDDALRMGQQALELFPDDAVIRLNVANILGKMEKFVEAEGEFKMAAELDPMNPVIYTNLGVLYHRWRKYKAARQMYNKALEINPRAQSARDNLKKLNNLLDKQKKLIE